VVRISQLHRQYPLVNAGDPEVVARSNHSIVIGKEHEFIFLFALSGIRRSFLHDMSVNGKTIVSIIQETFGWVIREVSSVAFGELRGYGQRQLGKLLSFGFGVRIWGRSYVVDLFDCRALPSPSLETFLFPFPVIVETRQE